MSAVDCFFTECNLIFCSDRKFAAELSTALVATPGSTSNDQVGISVDSGTMDGWGVGGRGVGGRGGGGREVGGRGVGVSGGGGREVGGWFCGLDEWMAEFFLRSPSHLPANSTCSVYTHYQRIGQRQRWSRNLHNIYIYIYISAR